jgi:hypothetical protein
MIFTADPLEEDGEAFLRFAGDGKGSAKDAALSMFSAEKLGLRS